MFNFGICQNDIDNVGYFCLNFMCALDIEIDNTTLGSEVLPCENPPKKSSNISAIKVWYHTQLADCKTK